MAGHSWALMPSVLIVEILSYLSLKDMLNASSICKTWRSYLFQAKLWPRIVVFMRRNRRHRNKFLADVCGRFVRECAVYFDPHDGEEMKDCYRMLQVLNENRNIQVLQLHPRSCHIEWTESVTSDRFLHQIESILRTSRTMKHLSLGCSEELLAHCDSWVDILSSLHSNSLESLHLASVKEDSENYGIVDLDVSKFQSFVCLKHLSIDYDHLNNKFLHIFSESRRTPLQSLKIHVHGVGPDHETVTNASWRQFSNHNAKVEVTINLIHSYTGVSNLLDILKPNINLTHFRQFFCSNMNVPALGLMSGYYSKTLKSVHIVDGLANGMPVEYEVTANEDPFVMMAWRCRKLDQFTLIGYHMSDDDLIAIARLRGDSLKLLHIPASCIGWFGEDGMEYVGNAGTDLDTMISSSLGHTWKPLEDYQLPDAVFDDWADAEQAYNEILMKDQTYSGNKVKCVILTELPLSVQLRVNAFCRSNGIKFISADVFGLFGGLFCDFGDTFEVADPNGEEPKECFIASITKDNPGVVTCLDYRMHGFESDDIVTFKEVIGMTKLNGFQCKIKVLSPYTFSICDTSGEDFSPYENGGIVTQVKCGKMVKFECLEKQIRKPSLLITDYSKFDVPLSVHAGCIAVQKYREANGRLPNIWCNEDAEKISALVNDLKSQGLFAECGDILDDVVKLLSYTCRGNFLPLCAALGGIAAQEGIKAITGKFSPLNQWLYLDALEVLKQEDSKQSNLFQAKNDRYDQLRICVGENSLQKLQELKLFMVGCGAIGCEMLKNYAMMGIGSAGQGQITITDNDLIEKSNLNRQFLFRPQHIRQPKSTTAAHAVKQINASLNIKAQQHKVCVDTENTVYPDSFFEEQDLIVNALDNVEARRYVDMRCVTAQRSLLESGTMGTKGHTQVIVAHLTESYGSQRDPPDEEVPYCTLKSFPANIEHCMHWARDKFESSFTQKPNAFNKFWSTNTDTAAVIERLSQSESIEGAIQAGKLLKFRPLSWTQCVCIGRLKFEKYFNHKAKHLLHAFPLDTRTSDGSLFWQSPKRPPKPLEFDPKNSIHLQFVIATAHLYADNNKIPIPDPINEEEVREIITTVKVPAFVPNNKKIEVEEGESSNKEEVISTDEVVKAGITIQAVLSATDPSQALEKMVPAEFEKDDDSNGHIDFISSAANLRGDMYNIENADRLRIKRIAGHIVPAIATTTAAVSGLVSIELVKVVEGLPIDKYRNTFLNLALPVFLMSEPGPAEKFVIKEGLTFTNWDRWDVHGNPDYTLQNLLDELKTRAGFETIFVSHGTKIVYAAFMPAHKKRLSDKMTKLLKMKPGNKYMDLVISFESMEEDDIDGPPIRYFF